MPTITRSALLGTVVLYALTGQAVAQDDPFANFEPVTEETLENPAEGDWLMFRRTFDGQGFSPLEQIDQDNVGDLQLAWSRGMEAGSQESTPLIHDGVMFLAQAPDVIQALDATNGDLIWEYRRELSNPCVVFSAGCPGDGDAVQITVSRNLAIIDDRLIHLTQDNAIIAIDARSGQLIWETQIRTSDNWGWQTSGPIIVDGLAISGRPCGMANISGDSTGCFISAHDVENGEEIWRFHTIPQPGEPGYDTWGDVPDEARRHVGTWMPPTYDPELGLVYFGTSVTSPWPKYNLVGPEQMDEEFLYQTSTLAIEADTGNLAWYQQHIRDHWDLDHPFTRILVDTAVSPDASEVEWIGSDFTPGEMRKTMTGIPGKTGIIYSLDRATGEFFWARQTSYQNAVTDIDTSNGRATMNDEIIPLSSTDRAMFCPSTFGGLDWAVGSYSPKANALFYPLQNLCSTGVTPGEDNVGTIRAYNAETGLELWTYETPAYTGSLLATGGGLVFGGDLDRRFRAFDDATGEVLWETVLPTAVAGTPVSYEVDGRQYVAVVASPPFTLAYISALARANYPDAGGNSIMVFALPE